MEGSGFCEIMAEETSEGDKVSYRVIPNNIRGVLHSSRRFSVVSLQMEEGKRWELNQER
jgi:hypothetical protein